MFSLSQCVEQNTKLLILKKINPFLSFIHVTVSLKVFGKILSDCNNITWVGAPCNVVPVFEIKICFYCNANGMVNAG